MRRLKIVVYFLILGILSSLLGNVSFAWASTQDKLVITEIYDLDLASAPLMFPVGSHHFQETIQAYSDCPLYAVCENENESTELIPSYDTRSVDVQKEGIYEMTMTLQYDKEMFQLSENYSETYTIPVCISDPEKFEIFPTFTSFHHTTLSFLHHFKDFSTIEGAYVKSKTALTQSQLNKAEWTTITSSENFNTTPDGVMLSSAFFDEDGYLYIKLTNENLTSNILCLEQKGELVRSKPIEGDRDGGDFSSEDPFEITSPVSTPDYTPHSRAKTNCHSGNYNSNNVCFFHSQKRNNAHEKKEEFFLCPEIRGNDYRHYKQYRKIRFKYQYNYINEKRYGRQCHHFPCQREKDNRTGWLKPYFSIRKTTSSDCGIKSKLCSVYL